MHRGHDRDAARLRAPYQDEVGKADLQPARGRTWPAPTAPARAGRATHSPAKIGASRMMKIGLIDWKIDAGTPAAIDEAVGEQVHRSAGLLEQTPEERIEAIRNRIANIRSRGSLGSLKLS